MKYYLKFFFFFISLVFLSSCSPSAGGGGSVGPPNSNGDGELRHSILSPFGTVVATDGQVYFAGTTTTATKTIVRNRYDDFAAGYGSSDFSSPKPYCRIGGTYKVKVNNTQEPIQPVDSGKPITNLDVTVDLFYCKTTKDLIEQIRIPESWRNSKLLFYCNDGNIINFQDINFEFLTSQINVYKGCVLKNLDLQNQNTIIYGFEVGNREVDDDPSFFFDPVSFNGNVVKDLTFDSEQNSVYIFKDNSGKNFFFDYDSPSTFYSLRDLNEGLTVPITDVFTLPTDFDISRVALFRNVAPNKIAYGYEKSAPLFGIDTLITKPVFIISLDGFDFLRDDCINTLARYNAKSKDTVGATDSVVCTSTNRILMNSINIDSGFNEDTSFNLFKNVILDLK